MILYDTAVPTSDLRDLRVIGSSQEAIWESLGSPESISGTIGHTDFPLLHMTIGSRIDSILRDGYLLPHRTLSERGDAFLQDTRLINTDELDKTLGLDQFVFLSHGRLAPKMLELSDDYIIFLFPGQRVDTIPQSIYSLKEICEYGAIVSQEGAHEHMANEGITEKQILERNMGAVTDFYRSLMLPSFFGEIFPQLLHRYQMNKLDYVSRLTYPGEEKIIKNTIQGRMLQNYWQGSQLMVPGGVPISMASSVICSRSETRKKIMAQLPDVPVYTVDHMAREMQRVFGQKITINEMKLCLMTYLIHNGAVEKNSISNTLLRDSRSHSTRA